MKYSIFSLPTLLAIIFLPFLTQNVLACQCYGFPSPYLAYREAKTVFIGKVVAVTDKSGNKVIGKSAADIAKDSREGISETYKYHFAVQESFKDIKSSEIIITKESTMCDFGFDIGEELLVYAYEYENNLYASTFCSRTSRLSGAQDDINILRDLLKGTPEPRIYGTVNLIDNDIATGEYRKNNLAGIKIIAKNQNNIYETVTDEKGIYRFYKIPDGKYDVAPQLPLKYTEDITNNYKRIYEINLLQDDGFFYETYGKYAGNSAFSSFNIRWNNHISGMILDADGKTLERANVRLIPVSQINKPRSEESDYVSFLQKEHPESPIRKYRVGGHAPGDYILAIEIIAPFVSGDQRKVIYYPQETTPSKAQIISLKEFDNRVINIQLPAGYNLREIEGELVTSNGTPIKQGSITLKTENENNTTFQWESVENGKFKFRLLENTEYWIHARSGSDESKPFKIKVGKINEPIKVVILPTIYPAVTSP